MSIITSILGGAVVFALLFFGINTMVQEKKPVSMRSWKSIEKKMSEQKLENIAGKKLRYYEKFKIQANEALKLSNARMTYTQFMYLTAISSVVGVAIGLLLRNVMLAVILGIAFLVVPLEILKIKQISYTQYANEQLQTALDIITNTYLQSEDIIKSVSDNLDSIEEPLHSIFGEFVSSNTMLDVNLVKNIRKLKSKFTNQQAREWCDMLILCQSDREQKYVLPSIVQQMGDLKIMQEEANTMMYNIYTQFGIVASMAIGTIPLLYILNKDWYTALVFTTGGKILVAVVFLIIILCGIGVVRINKPLEI